VRLRRLVGVDDRHRQIGPPPVDPSFKLVLCADRPCESGCTGILQDQLTVAELVTIEQQPRLVGCCWTDHNEYFKVCRRTEVNPHTLITR